MAPDTSWDPFNSKIKLFVLAMPDNRFRPLEESIGKAWNTGKNLHKKSK